MLEKLLLIAMFLNAETPEKLLYIVGSMTLYVILSSSESSFSLKSLLYMLFLCVTPCILTHQTPAPACRLQIQKVFEDYEYVQDGDIMIGGVITVYSLIFSKVFIGKSTMRPPSTFMCYLPYFYYYKNLLAFFYAVDEINKNPHFLPNLTLGYHIYDSCTDPRKAIRSILLILSGPGYLVPNYSCTKKKKVVGFIGDHFSSTTLPIAQLLGIYPYTQISYGATDILLSDRSLFSSVFRTVPNDYTTYSIIANFLSYFGWTWVGVIASDDDASEKETKLLTDLLTSYGICVAFVLKCQLRRNLLSFDIERNIEMIKKSSARIIITCGTFSLVMQYLFIKLEHVMHDRTLILNPTFSSHIINIKGRPQIFNLSFLFEPKPGKMPNMESYFRSFHPSRSPKDMILEDLWIIIHHCSSGKKIKDKLFAELYGISFYNCDGTEQIDEILVIQSHENTFQMYQAVQSLATALHDMSISHGHQTDHQMHHPTHKGMRKYLQAMMCSDESRIEHKCFTDKGDKDSTYMIRNAIYHNANTFALKSVGSYRRSSGGGLEFWIYAQEIVWKHNEEEIPRSRCSPSCLPGQRKVPSSSIHLCCHDCAPCSEGEISNTSDSENCMKCPEDAWSHGNRTFCVLKEIEYLSYTEDIISIVLSCLLIFFCILGIYICVIFVLNRETPIVRANNKNLSFVLLVSIMLSFLCVFLFLGRPVDITCMLRQISTGIFLSVSISSLLAKTIMVYIAFKATRPGSVWRTWTGVRVPNCVLLICSSVQVVLCMSWVTLSPPFQELDTHSYKEKVVVQCNEGSDLWFYSVLGYMGVLAAVSFITAFLARTLPDSFNEAKYITFSMLVFCSVWIAMIPAYLSTRGKYMVAVEIFAILTSNAGLLGCLFLPKCYILVWKPELNTRKHILEPKSMILHH
ncbi:vomeronasal type-2 receptor 26-like [Engystomops pustulosus]|uniref:vomeronasal type-2 receptor 26-like n=1 Tax=Engystomops pustulosus TaxID=76066 RepID=UPI003AFB75EA